MVILKTDIGFLEHTINKNNCLSFYNMSYLKQTNYKMNKKNM